MPAILLRSLVSLLLTAASLAGCVSHAPEKYRLAPDPSTTLFALAPRQALHADRGSVAAPTRARTQALIGYDSVTPNDLGLLDAERNGHPAQLSQVDADRDQLVGPIAALEALGGGQMLAARTDSAHP